MSAKPCFGWDGVFNKCTGELFPFPRTRIVTAILGHRSPIGWLTHVIFWNYLFFLLCLSCGCGSAAHVSDLSQQEIPQGGVSQSQNGVLIRAVPLTDPGEIRQRFGKDILAEGTLPVFVEFDSRNATDDFIITPEKCGLKFLKAAASQAENDPRPDEPGPSSEPVAVSSSAPAPVNSPHIYDAESLSQYPKNRQTATNRPHASGVESTSNAAKSHKIGLNKPHPNGARIAVGEPHIYQAGPGAADAGAALATLVILAINGDLHFEPGPVTITRAMTEDHQLAVNALQAKMLSPGMHHAGYLYFKLPPQARGDCQLLIPVQKSRGETISFAVPLKIDLK